MKRKLLIGIPLVLVVAVSVGFYYPPPLPPQVDRYRVAVADFLANQAKTVGIPLHYRMTNQNAEAYNRLMNGINPVYKPSFDPNPQRMLDQLQHMRLHQYGVQGQLHRTYDQTLYPDLLQRQMNHQMLQNQIQQQMIQNQMNQMRYLGR